MNKLRRLGDRIARWPALVAWLALIFALSSIPNELAPSPHPLPVDKIAHVGEFAVLAFLIVGAGRIFTRDRRATTALALAGIVLAIAYGATDEWHQRFVPGRDPSLSDLIADAIGAIAGACLAFATFRRGEDAA